MIQNMNAVSVSAYGSVLAERPHRQEDLLFEYREQTLELDAANRQLYRLEGGRLVLDSLDGPTVLALSLSPNPDGMEFFYLDKPVVLHEGVYFAVFSMFDRSSIRCQMQCGAQWRAVNLLLPDKPLAISRKLAVTGIYTFFYQEKEKAFFFKGDRHPMLELTYVDSGVLHSVLDGSDMVLSQGEMVVYGPNQWHMQYAQSDTAVSFFTITFDLQCPYIALLLGKKFSLDSSHAKMLQRIVQEGMAPDDFSCDMMIVLLEQLLLDVLRMEKPAQAKLRTSVSLYNENAIISSVQSYIADNLYSKIRVSTVAADSNISVSYLSMMFRRQVNMTIGEYIRRAKLEESRRLILEGRHSFYQIAMLLHYSSANHFSKQFKDYFGITPSQYARSVHP